VEPVPAAAASHSGGRVDMELIVTGTGRCGTKFIAMVLTELGYPCIVEKRFNYGGYSDDHKFTIPREASWMAAPVLDQVPADTVVHLVRHPRLVISSMLQMGLFTDVNVIGYCNYAHEYLPGLNDCKNPLDKAAYMYLEWNKMIEGYADILHRVEDRPEILLDKLGINKPIGSFLEEYYRGRLLIQHELPIAEIGAEYRHPLLTMMGRYGYGSWS